MTAQPIISNTVDVIVNVGAPVVVTDTPRGRVLVPPRHGWDQGEWYRQPAVIILALVLFFPAGLALMWSYSPWSDDTKWAVTGLFCWPIWTRFMVRKRWGSALKLVLIAVLAIGYLAVFTRLSALALLLIGVPAAIWAFREAESGDHVEDADTTRARQRAEATLNSCHEVIAEIERSVNLELAASDSGVRAAYLQALEARAEAAADLERARDIRAVLRANEKATDALRDLEATRQRVVGSVRP